MYSTGQETKPPINRNLQIKTIWEFLHNNKVWDPDQHQRPKEGSISYKSFLRITEMIGHGCTIAEIQIWLTENLSKISNKVGHEGYGELANLMLDLWEGHKVISESGTMRTMVTLSEAEEYSDLYEDIMRILKGGIKLASSSTPEYDPFQGNLTSQGMTTEKKIIIALICVVVILGIVVLLK